MQSVLQLVGFPHNDLRSGGNFVTLLSVHKIGTHVGIGTGQPDALSFHRTSTFIIKNGQTPLKLTHGLKKPAHAKVYLKKCSL